MIKPPFKLGISIGQNRGQAEFRDGIRKGEFDTYTEHPAFSIDRANRYIHDNYGDRFSLALFDNDVHRRKNRRRR